MKTTMRRSALLALPALAELAVEQHGTNGLPVFPGTESVPLGIS